MSKERRCSNCGVPGSFTRLHSWMPNGTILEKGKPDHRMVFIESESLRDTFVGIEKILGVSIERIITESQRRSTFESVKIELPAPVKALVRWTGTGAIARYLVRTARLNGIGDLQLVSFRRRRGKDDYIKLRIREPYSLPNFCGNFAGAMEAVDGREISVTYEEIAPGEYELTGKISQHAVEFKERFQRKMPHYKQGDIELERCAVCKGPQALSRYAWLLERGVIENRESKRRMVLVSTATQETIVDELTRELGESISQAAIEAQRELVTAGFFSSDEIKGVTDFRAQFAYRGLGNLREIELKEDHLHFRLENPCLHFMVVGLVQGLYEKAFALRSAVEWELTTDGDLVVDVRAK